MRQQSYTAFLQDEIKSFAIGEPILTQELAHKLAAHYTLDEKKAALAVSVAIKRLQDSQRIPALRCFGKGIYYLTDQTVFGETGINKQKLIEKKYLQNDGGYETGAGVMHRLGLTSLMPRQRTFVSNRVRSQQKKDEALGIIVKPPRTTVTKDNRLYLQFLDILSIYDEVPVDVRQPYRLLNHYVHDACLHYQTLLALADLYYGQDTILLLAHIASNWEVAR